MVWNFDPVKGREEKPLLLAAAFFLVWEAVGMKRLGSRGC